MNLVKSLLWYVVALVKAEPAITTGLLVSGLVALAGNLNIVIDSAPLAEVLTPLVATVLARHFVIPANRVLPTVPVGPEPLDSDPIPEV